MPSLERRTISERDWSDCLDEHYAIMGCQPWLPVEVCLQPWLRSKFACHARRVSVQQDKSDVTPVEDAAVAIDVDWSPASAVSVQLASHFAVQLGPSTRSLDHPRPDGVY